MGIRSYPRGDGLLGSDETRALPRVENQYLLTGRYAGAPIRTITTQNVLAVADAFACAFGEVDEAPRIPVPRRCPEGRARLPAFRLLVGAESG